jgi:hypothetical protein
MAKLFPRHMNWTINQKLVGDARVLQQLEAGTDPATIEQNYAAGLEQFLKRRAAFLLY